MKSLKKSTISALITSVLLSYGLLTLLTDCPSNASDRPSLTIYVNSKMSEKPLLGALVTMRDQYYLTGSPGTYRTRQQKTDRRGSVAFTSADFDSYTFKCRSGAYQNYCDDKPWNWRTANNDPAYLEVRIDVQIDGFEPASRDITIGSPGASETFYLSKFLPPPRIEHSTPPVVSETVEIVTIEQASTINDDPPSHSLRFFQSDTQDYKPSEQAAGDFRLQTVPVDCIIDIPQLGLQGVQKARTDWFIKNAPAGMYTVVITGLVPIKDAETQKVKMAEKTHQFCVPIRTKIETYVMIDLVTGEIRDIPAERLFSKALELAKKAQTNSDIGAWRQVLQYTDQTLSICWMEPKGVRELRDQATRIIAEAEAESKLKEERAKRKEENIKNLRKAIMEAREEVWEYLGRKRGHGQKDYLLSFKYKKFSGSYSTHEVDAEIKVTIDLGDALTVPRNALVKCDNPYADLQVRAEGEKTSIWHANSVAVRVYNKTAAAALKKLEKELAALEE